MLNTTLIINGIVSGTLCVDKIEINDIFIETGKENRYIACYYQGFIVYSLVCDNARLENKWPEDEIIKNTNLEKCKNLIIKFRRSENDKKL
jgi:hypothetical protein